MGRTSPQEVIAATMGIIEATYGNLGFLAFRLHSIKPNHKEGVYILKYSFMPRENKPKRLYYKGKVNLKDKNIFEIQEISEEDSIKDDS